MVTKIQGDDIEVEFIASDALGAVVAISSIFDYAIYIYSHHSKKRRLLVFRKTPGVGEYPIKIVDDPNGKISIVIPRAWTKTAAPDLLYAELKTQTTAGAQFENSKVNDGQDNFLICKLLESANATGL